MIELKPSWDKWLDDNAECYAIQISRDGCTRTEYAVPVEKADKFLRTVQAEVESWQRVSERLEQENTDLRAQVATLPVAP